MFIRRKSSVPDENPIVFIPGLFGSLGSDIIPGTGEFDFGMAEHAYRPFINNLEDMGYKEGRDLFIAYYDWRKSNTNSAEKYLIPAIEKAKEASRKHKVNLICHSMGGIVARAYIQTHLYNNDVQKLIMMGTPNCGSVNAYYFWSGGILPYEKIEKNVFYRLLKAGYLWLFKLKYGFKCNLEITRKIFPAAEELLPSYDNGDYLIFIKDKTYEKYIPIRRMSIKNDLLNILNRKAHLIYKNGIKTYLLVGSGVQTNNNIYVEPSVSDCDTWKDGKPLYTTSTIYGDGTVTCKSAQNLFGSTIYVNSDHMGILKDSREVIGNILMRKTEANKEHLESDSEDNIYCILADNIYEIQLTLNDEMLIINKENLTLNDSNIARKVGENTYWVMLKGIKDKEVDLRIYPKKDRESKVLILAAEKNNQITKIKDEVITNKLTMTL